MNIHIHAGDLPADVKFGDHIAIDTETLGLRTRRDALCLVQLSAGDGSAHLVQLNRTNYAAPRLKALLGDQAVIKIFHYARFDISALAYYLNVQVAPVWCTKIASRLVRTYTDNHGLKDLCRELLGVEISKQQQSSDWGSETLSKMQQTYAANDVLHLHALKDKLSQMLIREKRSELAKACFAFLPIRAQLDLLGWADTDIFSHSS